MPYTIRRCATTERISNMHDIYEGWSPNPQDPHYICYNHDTMERIGTAETKQEAVELCRDSGASSIIFYPEREAKT